MSKKIKKFESQFELIEYAKNIIGKTANDILIESKIKEQDVKNKGRMGQIVEMGFFGYDLNSNSAPDFEEIGIELKVTPLKKLVKGEFLSPKERVTVTQVNHDDLINNEELLNSNSWKKIEKILFIWYEHKDDWKKNEFMSVNLLELRKTSLISQIEEDWKIIRRYVLDGRMHEISESTTKYLGVARRGSGKEEKKISQPYSDVNYYKRAITLKNNLMKIIYNEDYDFRYKDDFFNFVNKLLVGKTYLDLLDGDKFKSNWKNGFPSTIYKIIGGSERLEKVQQQIENDYGEIYEFKVLPLVMKRNGEYSLKEGFKLNVNLVNQIDKKWDESDFHKIFENEFIVILYEHNYDDYSASKIVDVIKFKFNDTEIQSIVDAYGEFEQRYKNGNLTNGCDKNVNFIKESDNKLVHFRPTGKNSCDTLISSAGEEFKKTALWFNKNTIMNKIKNRIKPL